MISDEQVTSIMREKDYYLKMIDLVKMTFYSKGDKNTMYKVFNNVHKIKHGDEKIIYLLCVYIINTDDNIISILKDTYLLKSPLIINLLSKGINIKEINSNILKNYILENSTIDINSLLVNIMLKKENNSIDNSISCVDYNLCHLEKQDIKRVERRNQKLKRKIRRKVLYEKYQGR